MSQFKPYPAYMESGVEWLGCVPRHWTKTRLKWLFKEKPKELDTELPPGAISFGEIVFKEMRNEETLDSYQALQAGEFLVNPLNLNYDLKSLRIALSDKDVRVSPAYILMRPADQNPQPLFLRWHMHVFDVQNMKSLGAGVRQTISFADIGNCKTVIPPLREQEIIGRKLTDHISRIDALIEKKIRFIELLKEKRQALITHAVTKGLNPNAPMRDSRIEWLGKVPAHWVTGNLRRFATMKTGHTPSRSQPEYWEECTIPWFTLADVWQLREGRRKFLGETKEQISQLGLEHSAADLLPAGTVVFSRTASVGFSGIMPRPMATSQDFWNWIPSERLLPDYLLYLFRAMQQQFAKLTMGSTHKTVYQADAAGLAICLPPMEEQQGIVRHVESQLDRIDVLMDKTQISIDLLKERRSALITGAVTGKIDLREAA